MPCKGTTRAGKPCKSPPLKDSDFCLSHSDAKTRESVGFVADNGLQGRPRLPRPSDVARQLVEQDVRVTLAPYFRTLGYEIEDGEDGLTLVPIPGGGAKLYGESKDGEIKMTDYDDLGAMVNVSEKLQDRLYGKPTTTVQAQVESRALIVAFDAADGDSRGLLHELLRRRPAA